MFKIILTDKNNNTQTVTRGVGSHSVPVTFTNETDALQFCSDMGTVNQNFKFTVAPAN